MANHHCSECGTRIYREGLCWRCEAKQKMQEFLLLDSTEQEKLWQHIFAVLRTKKDLLKDEEALDNFYRLLSQGKIHKDLAQIALENEVFYPAELYLKAPASVRDQLISLLKTDNTLDSKEQAVEANAILCALAYQGDEVTVAALKAFEDNPPQWRQSLYVNPSIYAMEGGFTFDKTGKKQELCFDKCFVLRNAEEILREQGLMPKGLTFEQDDYDEDHHLVDANLVLKDKAHAIAQQVLALKNKSPVQIGKVCSKKCSCGRHYITLLSIDTHDDRFAFLRHQGKSGIISATCCVDCMLYQEAAYSRYEYDGTSTPLSLKAEDQATPLDESSFEQEEHQNTIEAFKQNCLVLASQEHPYYGLSFSEQSIVGGLPSFIQDPLYTKCPHCGSYMKFLAHIEWADISHKLYEGAVFIEICPECQITSMHHQQT